MTGVVVRSKLPRVKSFAKKMDVSKEDAIKGLVGGFDDALPGINQYTPEVFARLSKNLDFQKELKVGNFEIVEGGESAPESDGGESAGLEGFTVAEAVKLAGETENTKLLREWRDQDMREAVIAAIDKKLAAIEKERAGGDEIPTS